MQLLSTKMCTTSASMLFWAQPKAQAGLKGAETLKASAVDCPVIKYTRSQHFQKV